MTNAFQHAFPAGWTRTGTGDNEIAVSVNWNGTVFNLTVADNGVGMPLGLNRATADTMGLMLVGMLGRHQLQGTIELDRSDGTTFRLQFAPIDN